MLFFIKFGRIYMLKKLLQKSVVSIIFHMNTDLKELVAIFNQILHKYIHVI